MTFDPRDINRRSPADRALSVAYWRGINELAQPADVLGVATFEADAHAAYVLARAFNVPVRMVTEDVQKQRRLFARLLEGRAAAGSTQNNDEEGSR